MSKQGGNLIWQKLENDETKTRNTELVNGPADAQEDII